MSKDESGTNLRFGQGILIEGARSDDHIGFMTAKGFADTQAKYQTYTNILFFKNYRNAIFQILPSASFQINDELRKAKQTGEIQQVNQAIMKARARSQKIQFDLSIKSKHKNKVRFGNTVVFKHIDSETYLSGTIRPSSGSNGAFTVEVTEDLSQAMIFRLLPHRSYQFQGMPIPFDCPLKIKNQFNNGFLTFERWNIDAGRNERPGLFDKKQIQGENSYDIPVKQSSKYSKLYECVTYFVDLSEERQVPMPWKFKLHMNDVENDTLIQHDIVYLQHTEKNGVLTAVKDKSVILKQMKGESSSELCFYQCLWEIQKHQGENEYILRHLMSGMTLGIEYQLIEVGEDEETKRIIYQRGDPKCPTLIDITKYPQKTEFKDKIILPESETDNIGVIELRTARKAGGEINSGSFVQVCWGELCVAVKEQQYKNKTQKTSIEIKAKDNRINRQLMNQVGMNQLQYIERPLQFTPDIPKHCFVIMEIDDELKKDLLFALSFHSKIIELIEDLKYGATEAVKKVAYIRMMQVGQKIQEIKYFLKKCSPQQANEDYVHPDKKRQMICKDLGISELLFKLLYYMKKNEQEKLFQGRHNELEKFQQVYNVCYEVIIELIRNNYLFKVHTTKWILFVIDDVVRSNQPSRLNVLKEMLRENTYFVNNLVTEQLIIDLKKQLAHEKPKRQEKNAQDRQQQSSEFYEIKYLEIFRSLCQVGGKVNTNNQIIILDNFIKEISRNKKYTISLRMDNQQIEIEADINKSGPRWYPFEEYLNQCKEKNKSAWRYCVAYLNLMADLAQGRNKIVQNYVKHAFPLEVLTELLDDKYHLEEAEVPIIRLMHYLHIQSEQAYPIQRQQRILNYNDLGKQKVKMNQTSSKMKPWEQPLSKIMSTMSRKLQSYKAIDPQDYTSNERLFQVLNFQWQALNLGFYDKKQDLQIVLSHVLRVMSPPQLPGNAQRTKKYYEEFRKKSKNNILMVKCKQECLKIIQYILDYDEDLSIKRICQIFKQFEFPDRKPRTVSKNFKRDYSYGKEFVELCYEKAEPAILEPAVCSQLMELSNYGNSQLTSQSLSVMRRVLKSKELQIDKFTYQIFICEQQRIQLAKLVQRNRNQFFLLQDPNMPSVTLENQDSYYYSVYLEDESGGIMQNMYVISELMKNEHPISQLGEMKSLTGSGMYDLLATKRLINFTDERKSSNKMKQNVVDASNLHEKVLVYIQNYQQLPQEEQLTNKSPSEMLSLKLLHLSYKFLVCLIENYQDLKLRLVPLLSQIRHHIRQNLGCIDFYEGNVRQQQEYAVQ